MFLTIIKLIIIYFLLTTLIQSNFNIYLNYKYHKINEKHDNITNQNTNLKNKST